MTIFDDIRKDREDGTDGPWAVAGPHDAGNVEDSNGEIIAEAYGRGHYCDGYEADGRRIARVPELEKIAMAAEELADAASKLMQQCEDGNGYTERSAINVDCSIASLRKAAGCE